MSVSGTFVGLVLAPGEKGTKKLVDEFGARLLCVRYRYDIARGRRLKTVELTVEERDWLPRAASRHRLVHLRVAAYDEDLRERLQRAGALWNPGRKAWQLRHDRAIKMGLRKRILTPEAKGTV